MNRQFATSLKIVLNYLRALKFVSWNAHWTSKGPNFYGDHLLFEKIYQGDDDSESIDDLIDTLAEKMVFLGINVNDVDIFEEIYVATIRSFFDNKNDLPTAVFFVVSSTLVSLNEAYKKGSKTKEMSLGLDDYLMATSNHLETYAYLLNQRRKGWLN